MTSPVSMPAGHKILAADLDAYENLTAAFTSYVPTWTSTGTQPTIVNGTITGGYRQTGKRIEGFIELTIGSSDTFGTGTYRFLLPATPGREYLGLARAYDSSTGGLFGALGLISSGVARVEPLNSASNALWSSTVPMTWATGDQALIQFWYNVA